MSQVDTEAYFDQIKNKIIPELEGKSYDLVIGIPITGEPGAIDQLLEAIDKVVHSWMGIRQLIICAGDASAEAKLAAIKELNLRLPHMEFLLAPEIAGRGMVIRTFIAVSHHLEADLIVFNENLVAEKGFWLETLLSPIRGPYDMVLGSLRCNVAVDSIAHMMANPILETFYGCRVRDPLGGIYALSHDFIEELNHEAKFWGNSISGAGIDFWLVTRALCWNKNICEAILEGSLKHTGLEERNKIFRETVHAIFEALKRDSAIWLRERLIIKVVDTMDRSNILYPDTIKYPVHELIENFQNEYKAKNEWLNSLPADAKARLDNLSRAVSADFRMSDDLWVESIYTLLTAYVFDDNLGADDIISALSTLYQARVASYALEMQDFREQVQCTDEQQKSELLLKHMETIQQRLGHQFWTSKAEFIRIWLEKTEVYKPPLVPLGYMEYVPRKPVVVPKKVVGKDGCVVQTDNVYRAVRKRYEDAFNKFVTDGLGAPLDKDKELVQAVEQFMQEAETALEKILP
ncbi:MAG TPA: hypothetical protein DD811_08305, partial [Syntrophomonas sp.]|nr:hypothetical protein [Syntrophomonas sp.]